jgi:cytochrome c oxidase subunit III
MWALDNSFIDMDSYRPDFKKPLGSRNGVGRDYTLAMALDRFPNPRSDHRLPAYTGTLAMWWFIGGLVMLFGASMLGYLAIRLNQKNHVSLGTIDLPSGLWFSTALVLLASITIQLAVSAVRRERQGLLRGYVLTTLILGLAFCLVQVPCLWSLVQQHLNELARIDSLRNTMTAEQFANEPRNQFFGLIFVFILLHAAHVLGGIIHLFAVTLGAWANQYDHEFYNPVKHAAMYWHFLDVVWLVMFGTMFLLA